MNQEHNCYKVVPLCIGGNMKRNRKVHGTGALAYKQHCKDINKFIFMNKLA
jgi:hypothetical protein